ncbi:hypothetical protein K501DRAFT_288685 [Backusella circina FSU 941]|nr:hypothetical protein K501DRAFT_288685 [Backusella circina FSU 941]
MEEHNYIQSMSMAKLAEFDQSRTDLPIRKYVLIANLLRDHNREQHWFDACLDDLQEDDDQLMCDIDDDDFMSEQETKLYEKDKEEHEKCKNMTPLFYNLPNGVGFIMCTSSSLSLN